MIPPTSIHGNPQHIEFLPLLCAACVASLLFVGCDEGSMSEEVIDEAPSICRSLCKSEYACEWHAPKDYDGARDFLQDECIYSCAYYTDAGALIIERSLHCAEGLELDDGCVKYDEQELPAARVAGPTVESYLQCVEASGLMACQDKSFGFIIADADACSRYNNCIRMLDFGLFENATWDDATSSCNVAKQFDGERSYYLDILW
ncbi:MAG: hypothetical protein MUC50_13465 [Myxococcota bacterium]|jgi:hypothetical protein|nr:hypothetical protein [Myxococcota bacterium]